MTLLDDMLALLPDNTSGNIGASNLRTIVTNLYNELIIRQPLDSDLTTIAGLTATSDSVMQAKAGAWASRTIAQLLVDLAAVGTTFQPLDSDLTAIAVLTPANDDIVQRKAGAWTNRTLAQFMTDLAALGTTFPPTSRQILAGAGLTGGGDLSADRTLTLAGATGAAVGGVQLAGDLGGTATVPTVPALTGKAKYRGVWAPATVYAVNDLVTYAETLLICTVAHTSSTPFWLSNWADLTTPAWRFNVKLYGAAGDDVTDDTVAINNARAALFQYGLAGPNFGQLYFPPGSYLVGGATTQSATFKGNAQIPLGAPVATTAQKFHLEIVGGGLDNTGLLHWQQTSAQKAGATIRSTLVGTNDVTWGEASVFGGPTPIQGYGAGGGNSTFSNILVIVRGIQVIVPNDPRVCGIDLAGCAEANVENFGIKVNTTTATIAGPTQTWQFGLRMPSNNNNALSRIGTFTAYGMNYGLIMNEHCVVDRAVTIQCVAGVEVGFGGGTAHGGRINYLNAENCNVGIGAALGGGPATKCDVGLLDWEGGSWNGGTFAVINDLTGYLVGDIRLTQIDFTNFVWNTSGGNSAIRVTASPNAGAVQARIFDMSRLAGHVTAPALPATTVALFNPFFRDALIVVTGGTVTAVSVDGTAQGYTATGFSVLLPTCKTITLTYSVAPTWVWTLL